MRSAIATGEVRFQDYAHLMYTLHAFVFYTPTAQRQLLTEPKLSVFKFAAGAEQAFYRAWYAIPSFQMAMTILSVTTWARVHLPEAVKFFTGYDFWKLGTRQDYYAARWVEAE